VAPRTERPRHRQEPSRPPSRTRNTRNCWCPQIDIDPPNPQNTGKLWNEGPGEHRWLSHEQTKALKFLYADEGDGWNDMEITAKGMRIKSVLNRVTVVDYDGSGVLDDELHKKHNVGTKGVIGLQIHSFQELKLRFKDIRIKEL